MKALGGTHKKRLAAISNQVRKRLGDLHLDPALTVMNQVPWETDTYGWACSIGRLKGTGHSHFQLWLDLFPNVDRPVLSISLSANRERVLAVAKAHSAHGHSSPDFDNRDLSDRDKEGEQHMRDPLAKRQFDRPLLEFYDSPFLTVYLDRPPLPRKSLIDAILVHLEPLIGATAGALQSASQDGDFPSVTERKLVRRHEAWERSPSIALDAKLRDGFICKICGFNFSAEYGALGRGFAEAHHKKPLKVFRSKKVRHSAEDLVTVCANCHRMLHRLPGTPSDVASLKRALNRRRKSSSHRVTS